MAGADGYSVKPIAASELMARVQAHLPLGRARREARDQLAAERDRLRLEVVARTRAGEDLRQQAALLELAHDAIIVRDPHGTITSWNDGAADMYGWTASEAVGRVTHDLLHTRVVPSGEPGMTVDDDIAAHGVWRGDLEHMRRDGTRVIVESRQSLLRAADGSPEAIFEVNRDVTAREHLIRLHRVTTALSAAVTLEQVADVIVTEGFTVLEARVGLVAILSDDGSYFTNLRIVGCPPEVVAAWPGFPADAQVPIADAVRAGEPLFLESMEERRLRYPEFADMQQTSGNGAAVALPLQVGGRSVGGLGLMFDAARRFTSEERAVMSALAGLCAQALDRARLYAAEHQSRAEAEAMLGQIADAVIVIDTTGCTTFLNEAAKSLLGVDTTGVPAERRSEVYGMLTGDGAPFRAEDLPSMCAMRERRVVAGVDMLIRRLDGTETPVQENAAPIIADSGAVVGAVATLRDMSVQRGLERQKEDFLAAVAHDLKNPVAVLQGQAQLLRRRALRGPLELDQVMQTLAVIEDRARVMTTLIDELTDVSRLRMGQPLDLNFHQSDLVDIVRTAVSAQESVAEDHRFVLEGVDRELLGVWDAPRLARVLGNLLSNAVKFSPEGSQIRVRLDREDRDGLSWAVIAVQDEGFGIPARDLPHVFEWFYRAANVSGTVSGTGIGLAGARQIVEQHGGTIEVASLEGEGSTFTIRLPLDRPDRTSETGTRQAG